MLDRRRFLRSSPLLALAPAVPGFVARAAGAAAPEADRRILVVVQLEGGNDALNTVVPHADPEYARLRPTLKLDRSRLVTLADGLGLHPALRPLGGLLEAGRLAVLPGVGYPNPSRSHFESLAVWHTARRDPDGHTGYGWVGRALDPSAGTAYALGGDLPAAVRGRRSTAVVLNRVEEVLLANPGAAKGAVGPEPAGDLLAFVRRQAVDGYAAADRLAGMAGGIPDTDSLSGRLRLAARLIKAGLPARVIYAVQDGYDTHATQPDLHAGLLAEFGRAVAAFFADLRDSKLADRVTLLAFSEFGRAVRENGSGGTDHGTAGCVFLAGPAVRGGVVGTVPSLTDLDGGEPRATTDFRRVYAAALGWLGLPAADALGGAYDPVPVFHRG